MAHLGSSNKFYFDKELNRWVDPMEGGDQSDSTGSNRSVSRGGDGQLHQQEGDFVSPSGRKRGTSKHRPMALALPPTDAELGPSPPPTLTPGSRSLSPSMEMLINNVLQPPANVTMALAMKGSSSPKNGGKEKRRENSGDSAKASRETEMPTPSDRPPGWAHRQRARRDAARLASAASTGGDTNDLSSPFASPDLDRSTSMEGAPSMPPKGSKTKKKKRNRFALSKSKSKKLGVRSRYVDTFQSNAFGGAVE